MGILLGLFAAASSAGATTFCVPGFSVACPNDGINVVPAGATPVAKLDTAMSTDATDGVADTVFVDSGTFTRTASTFQAPGSDRLTVVGAGRDRTFLTSSLTSNSYVVNLAPGSREVTMRDLTIVIPESFPDGPGYGSGVQAAGDSFESVDLINRNPRSSGFNQIGSGTFADVRVFSDNGSRLERAVEQSSCVSGNLIVTDLGMNGSDYGIDVGCPQTPVTVKGLRSASVDQPLVVNSGGNLTVENALIESGTVRRWTCTTARQLTRSST